MDQGPDQGPRYDFPVVTTAPGDLADCDMFEGGTGPDKFRPGPRVGSVHFGWKDPVDEAEGSGESGRPVDVTFTFENEAWLSATGTLPQRPSSGGRWTITVTGRSGESGPAPMGSVVLETKNPKRWSIEGP